MVLRKVGLALLLTLSACRPTGTPPPRAGQLIPPNVGLFNIDNNDAIDDCNHGPPVAQHYMDVNITPETNTVNVVNVQINESDQIDSHLNLIDPKPHTADPVQNHVYTPLNIDAKLDSKKRTATLVHVRILGSSNWQFAIQGNTNVGVTSHEIKGKQKDMFCKADPQKVTNDATNFYFIIRYLPTKRNPSDNNSFGTYNVNVVVPEVVQGPLGQIPAKLPVTFDPEVKNDG